MFINCGRPMRWGMGYVICCSASILAREAMTRWNASCKFSEGVVSKGSRNSTSASQSPALRTLSMPLYSFVRRNGLLAYGSELDPKTP